jgi:hypothetical protein
MKHLAAFAQWIGVAMVTVMIVHFLMAMAMISFAFVCWLLGF